MTTSTTGTRDDGRVVLCGSMSVFAEIARVRAVLGRYGIDAVGPTPDVPTVDGRVLPDARREASLRHFALIRDGRTRAVLVVNVARSGHENHVGSSAFAEIAVAVADHRPVYLLHDVPDTYADELEAWGVRCLRGDLGALAERLRDAGTGAGHVP